MTGKRRAMVAVLATTFAMLGFGQTASSSIEASPGTASAIATAAATALPAPVDPPSGRTDRASVDNSGGNAPHGGTDSRISRNGRWDIFTSLDALQPSSPSANA
ncbi:MAG: hypothetical protein JWP39_1642, partial [Jatrophihabitans sp.]|nr:hypothetical protein [Jatrophihabitans sp.]